MCHHTRTYLLCIVPTIDKKNELMQLNFCLSHIVFTVHRSDKKLVMFYCASLVTSTESAVMALMYFKGFYTGILHLRFHVDEKNSAVVSETTLLVNVSY